MKKTIFILLVLFFACNIQAQEDSIKDALRKQGERIVDKYISIINFQREKTDSIMYVESYIVARNHPKDTMKIYRWYMQPRFMRMEIWQDGKIEDGFYTDNVSIFRRFHSGQRAWMDLAQDNFYNYVLSMDIRGALYEWRSKGAEITYAGEYNLDGHQVDRVYVICPGFFDRHYFFEKESGMLFMLTEERHTYTDGEINPKAVVVDWRAWNEFTPYHGFFLPTVESYQAEGEVVVIHHKYKYIPKQGNIFTDDYIKRI